MQRKPHSPAAPQPTGGVLGPILIICAMVCFLCGMLVLNKYARVAQERLAHQSQYVERVEWTDDRPTGLRVQRDPLTNCEYVSTRSGVTPRLNPDGTPRCPTRLDPTQPEQ